jgi:hypothetical protein
MSAVDALLALIQEVKLDAAVIAAGGASNAARAPAVAARAGAAAAAMDLDA